MGFYRGTWLEVKNGALGIHDAKRCIAFAARGCALRVGRSTKANDGVQIDGTGGGAIVHDEDEDIARQKGDERTMFLLHLE